MSQELQDMSPTEPGERAGHTERTASSDQPRPASSEGSSDDVVVPEYDPTVMDTFRNRARYIFDNAPMLRFVNRNNRYNHLDGGSGPLGHAIGESMDGVFSNMSAKPTLNDRQQPANHLPSYDEATEDPVPPYWESSIMAGYDDEIFIEGLPVGNMLNFVWNMVVSIMFQFVGFVITYLLHTSHASKNGSQAGLGLTLMSFGWSTLPFAKGSIATESGGGQKFEPDYPGSVDVDNSVTMNGKLDGFESSLPSTTEAAAAAAEAAKDAPATYTTYFSYSLLVLGIIIFVKAFVDYYKICRKEKRLMHPAETSQV